MLWAGAAGAAAFFLAERRGVASGALTKWGSNFGWALLPRPVPLSLIHISFLGYFRNVYIFGQDYTIAKALTKITGGVTFVNSVASTVCVVLLYLALRPALERANLLPKAEKKAENK